ncbi:uncharacterized protein LOC135215161 [Macrobrachium nipponense]|uniref:uncharacterized protein LOC135215161 n=1 Tax=Macrobrachium nipponense TaxID=159736 RepID=UPI0030C8B6ED
MAYETILQKFRDYYPEGTKEELKKKINSLRTSFRKELKKIKDSSRSGAGADEIYEPSLWCFDALWFLSDHETPASSRSTIQSTEEIEDDQEGTTVQDRVNESTNLHPVPAQPAKRKKLAKVSNRLDELIALACEHLQRPENEFLTMAKAWANDLSKMDPKQLLLAKKGINDIIFEGLCGNLHRQSVQIHPIPQETRCWTPSSDTCEYAPSPYGSHSNPPISSTMGHHSDYRDAVPHLYPNMAARN